MLAHQNTLLNLAKASHHLYNRGYALLALLLMILALAYASLFQSQNHTTTQHEPLWSTPTLATLPTHQQDWQTSQTQWLSQKANTIVKDLKNQGIQQLTVYSRVKSLDSATEKAQRKGISMHELNDIYGMRIVVANELDVYQCLNHICHKYDVVPGTLKNYIIAPKASGYQSIHVVTQVDDSHKIEFQIRTESMHNNAEAEHEAYKNRMRMTA